MEVRVDRSTEEVIRLASAHLTKLRGECIDVIEIAKPRSAAAMANLAKVVSKLSPILGNLIEFNTVEFLNLNPAFAKGKWRRQDPGFPDAIFDSDITPAPGFEIKAWFPLATEITARFKDSQRVFAANQTYVVLIAWLPEFIIFGKPKILDMCIVSGDSVARARDSHYHRPPDYIVVEPYDTSARTANLQQTNTSGYKFQGNQEEFAEAEKFVADWGEDGRNHSHSAEYQRKIRALQSKYEYRLDTNFAKADRIRHPAIEAFKARVERTVVLNKPVSDWARLITSENEQLIEDAINAAVSLAGNPKAMKNE
jgi:hypothetical protein